MTKIVLDQAVLYYSRHANYLLNTLHNWISSNNNNNKFIVLIKILKLIHIYNINRF